MAGLAQNVASGVAGLLAPRSPVVRGGLKQSLLGALLGQAAPVVTLGAVVVALVLRNKRNNNSSSGGGNDAKKAPGRPLAAAGAAAAPGAAKPAAAQPPQQQEQQQGLRKQRAKPRRDYKVRREQMDEEELAAERAQARRAAQRAGAWRGGPLRCGPLGAHVDARGGGRGGFCHCGSDGLSERAGRGRHVMAPAAHLRAWRRRRREEACTRRVGPTQRLSPPLAASGVHLGDGGADRASGGGGRAARPSGGWRPARHAPLRPDAAAWPRITINADSDHDGVQHGGSSALTP